MQHLPQGPSHIEITKKIHEINDVLSGIMSFFHRRRAEMQTANQPGLAGVQEQKDELDKQRKEIEAQKNAFEKLEKDNPHYSKIGQSLKILDGTVGKIDAEILNQEKLESQQKRSPSPFKYNPSPK
jgi:DNA repair exonuclease SbcCD ATPase subunit